MKDLVLVLDNIRSALNVGAIIRTAAGLGVKEIFAVGLTPYPKTENDQRLPHVAERATRQIVKTSLGAEGVVTVTPINDALKLVSDLKVEGYDLIAIENTENALPVPEYRHRSGKAALVLGSEVDGVSLELLNACDVTLVIPTSKEKKSLNVSAAAAIAIYHFRFKA